MTNRESRSQSGMALLKTVLTIAFIVAGTIYVTRRMSEFQALAWPSVAAVVVVAFGFLASVFFRSLYNYIVCRQLGAAISLRESFMLSAVVTASNALLPANPGATFRAVYMKKVHAFPYSYFASSTALSFVITTLMMSLIGMTLLLMINHQLGYFRLDLFVALPVIAVLMTAGLLLRKSSHSEGEESVWAAFQSSYLELTRERRLVYLCILIVCVNFFVAAVVWFVALGEYDSNITLLEGFLFAASQIVSGLISLTPGAAGFQELVGIYVGRSFELTAVELFAILVWVRLVRMLTAVLLGIPCAIALRYRSR